METNRIDDSRAFFQKAMITLPTAITGAITTMRKDIIRACWIWLTSFVVRVINEAIPKLSTSSREKVSTFSKIPFLRSRAKRAEICEDKKLVQKITTKVIAVTPSIAKPVRKISSMFPVAIQRSTIFDIKFGRYNSVIARVTTKEIDKRAHHL